MSNNAAERAAFFRTHFVTGGNWEAMKTELQITVKIEKKELEKDWWAIEGSEKPRAPGPRPRAPGPRPQDPGPGPRPRAPRPGPLAVRVGNS